MQDTEDTESPFPYPLLHIDILPPCLYIVLGLAVTRIPSRAPAECAG
jgi:hypothetical protein